MTPNTPSALAPFTESMLVPSTSSHILSPPVGADEVRIVAGGAGWMGTFALLARTMIRDLLTDNAPIYARFVVRHGDSMHRVVAGEVTSWSDDDAVTFTDGLVLVLDVEELCSVSI